MIQEFDKKNSKNGIPGKGFFPGYFDGPGILWNLLQDMIKLGDGTGRFPAAGKPQSYMFRRVYDKMKICRNFQGTALSGKDTIPSEGIFCDHEQQVAEMRFFPELNSGTIIPRISQGHST